MPTATDSHDAALPAERRALLEEIRAAWDDGERLLEGLDDAAVAWRPEPGRWGVGDCVGHLLVTGELYLPRIEQAITRGRADPRAQRRGGAPDRPVGRLGLALVRSQEPPVRQRLRSPRAMASFPDRDAETLRAEWTALHESLQAWVRDSAMLDLSRLKVGSPVFPLLRMRVDTALRFLLAHERRHLWQGWAVRRDARFPAMAR